MHVYIDVVYMKWLNSNTIRPIAMTIDTYSHREDFYGNPKHDRSAVVELLTTGKGRRFIGTASERKKIPYHHVEKLC